MSSTMANSQAQTVDTRIGKLSFEHGLPTEHTVTELFDTFDFQRACEAYVLTPNATTPYVVSFVNLMRTGPVVIDLPAGPNASGVCQLAADAEAGRLQHGTAHLWSGRCNHESDLAAPNGKESAVTAR